MKWFIYRPLFEGKLTFTELNTCVTMDDLFEINALLDMIADIKYQLEKEAASK
jgi:hypothetical protein